MKEGSEEGSSFLIREEDVRTMCRVEMPERSDHTEQQWKEKISRKRKGYKE